MAKPNRKKLLKERADRLSHNIPKSELWFYGKYYKYKLDSDNMNVPFCGYIPDLINKTYKYIIEIDGSIHQLKKIQKRDRQKDKRFTSEGYTVIRIIAYDDKSFEDAMVKLQEVRYGKPDFPVKTLTKEEIDNIYEKFN